MRPAALLDDSEPAQPLSERGAMTPFEQPSKSVRRQRRLAEGASVVRAHLAAAHTHDLWYGHFQEALRSLGHSPTTLLPTTERRGGMCRWGDDIVDRHRAGNSHAPQIVACQIHQHHVLGIFLRIATQLGFKRRIARLIGAAGP